MFFQHLEDLVIVANNQGKSKIGTQLMQILETEMDKVADMTRICPYIDSYMHEVEKNLHADELTWRHYTGDGNQRRMTVSDVVGDNRNIYYENELKRHGWSESQIETIIAQAITKYTG